MMQSSHKITKMSLKEELSNAKFEQKFANKRIQKLMDEKKALQNAISQRKVDDTKIVSDWECIIPHMWL